MDWDQFLAIALHHRVEPMVFSALCNSGIAVPSRQREKLRLRVHALTFRALSLSIESVRIQRLLSANGISSLLLKGAAIGALAYGQQQLKCSWDIDLLLEPQDVPHATALLGGEGYEQALHARTSIHDKEVVLRRATDQMAVELHWRLHNNPALLGSWTPATLPSRIIDIAGGTVRTLADEQHYVYLAVHGASHAWFRLKWLVDFSWWLALHGEQDLHRFHAAAVRFGAARCSAQGLLLAHEMLGLQLPATLHASLRRDSAVRWLVKLAERAIANRGGAVELAEDRLLARVVLVSQLLLSTSPGYRRAAFAERWQGLAAGRRRTTPRD